MAREAWLPKGFVLPDGAKLRGILYCGEEWQIFDAGGAGRILLARLELAQKWTDGGFLADALFGELAFGTESFRVLASHRQYALAPVEGSRSPENKVDALAFAFALKESRKLSAEVFFHDAVYVEQYSRLLPTWTSTPPADDETVLGTWMSGGVVVSTNAFRRLTSLTGWMPADALAEVITTAGLEVPGDAGLFARHAPSSPPDTEEQPFAARESPRSQPPENGTGEARTFELPGRPQLEGFFNEHVIDIIFHAEKYQALGIAFPSAIVLHGPPGCGKTFAVERLVEFIGWPSYSIDSGSIGSPYIHETGKKISGLFDKAIDNAPSVIVIDEMESFLSARNFGAASGLHHVEEVAEFLRRIPEAIEHKVLIIGMTNMIDLIDPAILRRGRFDHVIKVEMPSREEVASLVNSLLGKVPKAETLDLGPLLDALAGRALSDSAFVIREAARLSGKAGKTRVDQESLDAALGMLPRDESEKKTRIGFIGNA